VQPATGLAWQRTCYHEPWAHLGRKGRAAHPTLRKELQPRLRKFASAIPRWGSPGSLGEVRKVGVAGAKSPSATGRRWTAIGFRGACRHWAVTKSSPRRGGGHRLMCNPERRRQEVPRLPPGPAVGDALAGPRDPRGSLRAPEGLRRESLGGQHRGPPAQASDETTPLEFGAPLSPGEVGHHARTVDAVSGLSYLS
jgi:hypothetical protein